MLMLADAPPHMHRVVEYASGESSPSFFFGGFPMGILVKDDFSFAGFSPTAAVKSIAAHKVPCLYVNYRGLHSNSVDFYKEIPTIQI